MCTSGDADDALAGLVRAAQEGDGSARERLVVEHLGGLRAYVRLKMKPTLRAKESCSDVVQSVCREALEDLDGFEYRGPASFRHWLYRLALHKVIDKQRYWNAERRDAGREVARDRIDPSGGSLELGYRSIATPSAMAIGAEEATRIEEAFDRLGEDQREAILLSRLVGLSHREIAEKLGRSEEASRNLLRRGLVRLAALLDTDG